MLFPASKDSKYQQILCCFKTNVNYKAYCSCADMVILPAACYAVLITHCSIYL